MATTHKITALRTGFTNGMDWEAEYEITFNFTRGRPAKMYLRNGDPGYPADPDEVEFVSISPGAGDHGAFSDLAQKNLEDWAVDWLADHDDDACDRAMSDIYAEEDAREEARNNGQFGMGA